MKEIWFKNIYRGKIEDYLRACADMCLKSPGEETNQAEEKKYPFYAEHTFTVLFEPWQIPNL